MKLLELRAIVFNTLASMTVILSLAIFIHSFGPSIEGKLMPIVKDFVVEELVRESPTTIHVSGTMNILRTDCRFQSVTAYIFEPSAPQPMRLANVSFTDTNNKLVVRIKGYQKWGPWEIQSALPNVGYNLKLISHHTCHGWYLVSTHLVDIRL